MKASLPRSAASFSIVPDQWGTKECNFIKLINNVHLSYSPFMNLNTEWLTRGEDRPADFDYSQLLFWKLMEWNQQVKENVIILSTNEWWNIIRLFLLTPQEFFFIRRPCYWWHIPRISLVLEANVRQLSKIVSIDSSHQSPHTVVITSAASSLCFLLRFTTMSLGLYTSFHTGIVKPLYKCIHCWRL